MRVTQQNITAAEVRDEKGTARTTQETSLEIR
jgi:hypothetical protein